MPDKPDKKVKVPWPDPTASGGTKMVEGSEVGIKETTERWTDVTLEDGTVLKVKPTIFSAIRISGMYDNDGNPMYALRGAQTMAVVDVPDSLKKSASNKLQ